MRIFRTIIVEDEPTGLNNLKYKLNNYCPEINIVAECLSADHAINEISRNKPDVVFLDIRLDGMTGFDVLDSIPFDAFEIIITTDYNEYAIEAIKKQALDYLVKPIKKADLLSAVRKLHERKGNVWYGPQRVVLPVPTGEKFVDIHDILYIEAQNTRSLAYFISHKENLLEDSPVELTRLLRDMHVQLGRFGFCRPNKSFLVNMEHINEYIRRDGGWIIMRDGKAIHITNRFRESFRKCRNNWFMNT